MAKRTPLVCQQLENISRQSLERHQDIVRRHVRSMQSKIRRCCVPMIAFGNLEPF